MKTDSWIEALLWATAGAVVLLAIAGSLRWDRDGAPSADPQAQDAYSRVDSGSAEG